DVTVPRRTRFLLVADEWSSNTGGISTLNRELAIALAYADVDVHVVVPAAVQDERDAALKHGVYLVSPEAIPGITRNQLLLARPTFSDESYEPDVVIGHGRLFGPYACALQRLYFPAAKRVHVVHMDPDRLEDAKQDPGGPSRMLTSNQRRELEVQL